MKNIEILNEKEFYILLVKREKLVIKAVTSSVASLNIIIRLSLLANRESNRQLLRKCSEELCTTEGRLEFTLLKMELDVEL